MSRKVMQQALEALEWNYNTDLDNIPACEQWAKMLNEIIPALKQALAELDSDYERGFVDGMNLQTKGSVDKAVNRMAQNPFGDDAERYARKLHEERESYKALFTERKPLTDEEVVALFNRLCQERSAWPERRYRDFARWVERAHGITGESK